MTKTKKVLKSHHNVSQRKNGQSSRKNKTERTSKTAALSEIKHKDGWVRIKVEGEPYDRGMKHGTLLSSMFPRMFEVLGFGLQKDYGHDIDFFLSVCNDIYKPIIHRNYPEFLEEMRGIADGAGVSLNHIILVNIFYGLDVFYPHLKEIINSRTTSLSSSIKQKYKRLLKEDNHENDGDSKPHNSDSHSKKEVNDRCSLIMAVGSEWTSDGKILYAHNTMSSFLPGQFYNVIIDVTPPLGKGNRMIYQGLPGAIFAADFFINSAGFIGGNTTIANFTSFEHHDPIGLRIRQCMQYATSLEEYDTILRTRNSGDYASSWMFGDTVNNRIMRIELGVKYINTEYKDNGYFVGFNSTYDERIRKNECGNHKNGDFDNIKTSIGNRRRRLEELMEKYKGSLDREIAKKIITDHYDIYGKKTRPNHRTICKHAFVDGKAPRPYQPSGSYDAKVADTTMVQHMEFLGRWGIPCGATFDAASFSRKHKQWREWGNHIRGLNTTRPWSIIR